MVTDLVIIAQEREATAELGQQLAAACRVIDNLRRQLVVFLACAGPHAAQEKKSDLFSQSLLYRGFT